MAEQKEMNSSATISKNDTISCAIQWDKFEDQKSVDLDISAVVLDQYSFELDAVYFKQVIFIHVRHKLI